MRKNSPRKWLHACLDLLPVILIPVFMIYSHRHDVIENVEVTYKYESNEVDNRFDNLVNGNIYHFSIENDILGSNLLFNTNDAYLSCYFINIEKYDFSNLTLDYDDEALQSYQNNGYLAFNIDFYPNNSYFNLYLSVNENNDYLFSFSTELSSNFTLVGDFIFLDGYEVDFDNVNFVTQSSYNEIESVDIENTDIMDSFMNHFNNTIDKHFNMGNVFNLTGVYQWFNTNIFNGNAPQVIYSVWNIALYELVMDLLFLLYGLFMWFIDMVQHLMDKPFKSIK